MEQELIDRIERFASDNNMKPSTVCRLAINDGKFFERIKSGGSFTYRTMRNWEKFFSENGQGTA
jgi:hypothetical protein